MDWMEWVRLSFALILELMLFIFSQVRPLANKKVVLPLTFASSAIMTISSALLVILILEESRSDAILGQRAKKLTKETGKLHTTEFEIINSSRSMVAALKTSSVLFSSVSFSRVLSAYTGEL